jgi:spore germination protein PE
MVRLSVVNQVRMNVVTSSSTLQIGDSQSIHLLSNALAVQKEVSVFEGTEGDLSPFYSFRRGIPRPVLYEPLQYNREDVVPVIKVGAIRVISAAASSLVHIGSTGSIDIESRIKHFRHYQEVPAGYRLRSELTIQTPQGGVPSSPFGNSFKY